MKTQHTLVPWQRNIKANGKYPVIFSGRNTHVCTASQMPTGEETEANIDLIIIAVNSHEKLLGFAKGYLSFLKDHSHEDNDGLQSLIIEKLNEAIAQAEGE